MKLEHLEKVPLVEVLQLEAVVVATKSLRRVLFSLLIFISNLSHALADMMAKGKTKVKTVFNFYHQNSDDGKQVFDNSGREEANVIEPMIFIEHQINEDTAIKGHFVFDFWTAASDTKLDGNTGASGEEGIKGQSRTSANIGLKREVDKLIYSASFGFSSEYDYRSLNISGDISRSFKKDNFTLGLGFQLYKDSVKVLEDLSSPQTAVISEFKDRNIAALSLNASQILTKRDIVYFGVNFIQAKDNLESTASSVKVSGVRKNEILPQVRKRYAASLMHVHGLSETSAINYSYRYYWDDWDLDAHTARLAYLFEINENEDFIELFARYHSQENVKYFKESFNKNEEFMTSDSDMGKFSSYEVGVYHSMLIGDLGDMTVYGFKFENMNWGNSIVYSNRDNGMRYGYLQTSLSLEF